MFKGVIIKKLKRNKDSRGWLVETFRKDELDAKTFPAMSYVSMTKPGVVRGPHEHAKQTDIFVFIGPGNFELHLWDNRKKSSDFGKSWKKRFGESNPTLVVVPPGVVHGYKNISKKEAWCLNFPNKLYAGKNKKEIVDEIRHEKDPESRFKI